MQIAIIILGFSSLLLVVLVVLVAQLYSNNGWQSDSIVYDQKCDDNLLRTFCGSKEGDVVAPTKKLNCHDSQLLFLAAATSIPFQIKHQM